MLPPPFQIVEPHPGVPRSGSALVAHVPHASLVIPAEERASLLLDDTALQRELLRMTDIHTDRLFDWVVDRGGTAFIHRRSRLVMDPERFADPALEPMEAVGQGAVYTLTSDGLPLRELRPGDRERIISTSYEPYHRALSALVSARLAESGRCLILDCHSFGSVPLPSEADQSADRPDICIGTDAWHTPTELATAMTVTFAASGFRVRVDSPFGGALVPLDRYRSDQRVTAVMIEVRRGLYCDEATGEPGPDFAAVRTAIEQACIEAGLLASDTRP